MAGGFTAVDLSRLPFPGVVETLSFEQIFNEMLGDLRSRDQTFDALVESDPAYKILEVAAFREVILRARVNEAAKAVMLAYAAEADLDQIGARYNVERLTIDHGDPDAIPPIPATQESDESFRRRIGLSLEGYSTAGPVGAYIFHALGASGDVKDANATSPAPGQVVVTVLSRHGTGIPSEALLDTVDATVNAYEVRPLTDHVSVEPANIQHYAINANLFTFHGPDYAVVMAEARRRAEEYVNRQHAIGRDVSISGVYAALHVEGVQRVELIEPAETIFCDEKSAAYCTNVNLVHGGIDE